MATYTSYLALKQPTPTEDALIQDINDNMDKIDDFVGTLRINIGGLSAADNSAFVSALGSAINSRYSLSSAPIGSTFTGFAEWTGVTYMSFVVIKVGTNACNVEAQNGATKYITGRFAINNFEASYVNDFIGECRNENLGAFSTVDALTDILDAALAAMPSSGVKAFQVNATSTVGYFGAATYLCMLCKSGTNTTYASATFRRVDSPIVIDGARNTNGWSFNSLTSKIAQRVRIATYSFSQSINATTEASFTVSRTDLNLPTNAVVVDGYIRQNSSSSTNNTWAYSFQIAPTSNTTITGRIYNPTNSNRSYAIMCVVFYTDP